MAWLTWIRTLLRTLVSRRRLDEELDDELRLHLELETEQNLRAGMSPEEAHRQAMLAFGGVERCREQARDVRGMRPLEDAWRDVRHAVRSLRRTPGSSLLAILTLALAIAAGTTTYSVVSAVVLNSLPFRDPDRLVNVQVAPVQQPSSRQGATMSLSTVAALMGPAGAFQGAAPFYGERLVLTGLRRPEWVQVCRAGPDYFAVLGTRALLGRTLVASDVGARDGVAVVSHRFWVTHLGGAPDAVGHSLTLNGRIYQVVGVMPRGFALPEDAQVWIPAPESLPAFGADDIKENPGAIQGSYWLVARLAPGLTVENARARLASRFRAVSTEWKPTLEPVKDEIVGAAREPLLLLLGTVAMVLLVACANVAALLLARGVARRRELATRLALGASRTRVLRQLLTESLVISLVSGTAGTALAFAGVPALVSLARDRLPRMTQVGMDWHMLGVSLVATVFVGLLAGLLPAAMAVREDPSTAVKDGSTGAGTSRRRLRLGEGLVVLQVALGTVLLAGGALLGVSFMRLVHVNLGFDVEQVAVAQLHLPTLRYGTTEQRQAFVSQILEKARAIPGARAVAASSGIPFRGNAIGSVDTPDRTPATKAAWAWFTEVTPGFFRVFGMPILRGRALRRVGSEVPDAVVVNEAFARTFFPGEDPLGHAVVYYGSVKGRIVGVVGDVRQQSLGAPPPPQLYDADDTGNYLKVSIRTAGNVTGTTAALERAIHAVDPLLPIDRIGPMTGLVSDSVSRQRLYAVILGAFSFVALLIAALGMYGLTAYTVRSRTREIGVRMALGASRRHVGAATVGRTAALAVLGVALGLLGAAAGTRLLSSLLFGLSPTDPSVFGGVALVLAGVSVLAAVAPARRAATVDPMVVLRTE